MSPLWRGFAGLVAVFLLVYYIGKMESESERERTLIMKSDPVAEAQQAFDAGEYFFYQRYLHRIDPKSGADIGYWILQGESKIAPEILQAHPERIQLKQSLNYGLTPEHQSFNKRIGSWLLKFNLKMADLLSE